MTDVPFRSITLTIEARYLSDPTTQFTVYTIDDKGNKGSEGNPF